jgi:hypothetical protein
MLKRLFQRPALAAKKKKEEKTPHFFAKVTASLEASPA